MGLGPKLETNLELGRVWSWGWNPIWSRNKFGSGFETSSGFCAGTDLELEASSELGLEPDLEPGRAWDWDWTRFGANTRLELGLDPELESTHLVSAAHMRKPAH